MVSDLAEKEKSSAAAGSIQAKSVENLPRMDSIVMTEVEIEKVVVNDENKMDFDEETDAETNAETDAETDAETEHDNKESLAIADVQTDTVEGRALGEKAETVSIATEEEKNVKDFNINSDVEVHVAPKTEREKREVNDAHRKGKKDTGLKEKLLKQLKTNGKKVLKQIALRIVE